jgi:hypothetical protein
VKFSLLTNGRTRSKDVSERGAQESIWTYKDVTGGWKKLHNEEFHNLYSSSDDIRVMRRRKLNGMQHVERMRQMRNAQKTSQEYETKGTSERPRHRQKENIKIEFINIKRDCKASWPGSQ